MHMFLEPSNQSRHHLLNDKEFDNYTFENNVFTIEMSSDESIKRMQTLLDKLDKDEEPKPVKTKMSYKQQQRMRKNNPMWKPN